MPKNPAAVALGRLGGKKGGPARARKLSKAQRKAVGLMGVLARQGVESKLIQQGRNAIVDAPGGVHVIVDREDDDAEGTER